MSHRYSREEKKKWISSQPQTQTNRKPPVQIPEIDTTALIEENKFTLIGRVTNPAVQNTKALVEFFLQHWNVSGRITGRDLGPLLFQFRFENEKDLLTILNKAPFHFKRWMILVQRWEPVVSDKFPAFLPFWIQINGLPLHYWSDEAIRAIGKELGKVEDCIPTQARVRVLINGLNPLEMTRDIILPSGEITEVEFNYDNLQKHCFRCHSLSHEKDDCPIRENSRERDRSPSRIGISQRNTMARLDENRRKYEERRREKSHHAQQKREAPLPYARRNNYEDHRTDERYNSRHQTYAPVTSEYRRGREDYIQEQSLSRESGARAGSRSNLHGSGIQSKATESQVRGREGRTQRSEDRRTPSHDSVSKLQSPNRAVPIPHSTDLRRVLSRRDEEEDTGEQVSSGRRPIKERILLPGIPSSTDLRRSLSLRDERDETVGQLPADKPSAKQRLSLPSNGKSRLGNQGNSTGSSRLQDIEIQYLEETMELPHNSNNRPSGSRPPRVLSTPLEESSPIRSLSEDRRHVSLRLGPQPMDSRLESPIQNRLPEQPVIVTRSVAKKKEGKMPQKKKYTISPLNGVSMKKRRVTKTQNSPKRRTQAGNIAASSQRQRNPTTTIIPAITKKHKDFRVDPSALP
ncbi:hypothetical protein Bca101_046308 [Brassica carinata]